MNATKVLTVIPNTDGKLSIVKGSTMTVAQFCASRQTSGIDVKESTTKPGHYFMVHDNGNVLGPVSNRKPIAELTEPVISEYKGDITELNPDGFFFMLHQKGNGGAPVVVRFNA